MQILVTGARGKVGAATIHDLIEAGHRVTGCDLVAPVYEGGNPGAHYFQADLTDPGDAFAVVRGQDVVIHCAALPEPTRNAPHKVFGNNLMATFNLVEACVRVGVDRLVNVSSETVAGMAFAERPFHAPYAPIDEALREPPAGPLRAGQGLRRAADGRRRRALGPARDLDPAVLGAVGGQLRALPRAVAARPASAATRARASGATSTSTTSRTRCGWRPRARSTGHEAMYVVVARQRHRPAAARS